MIQRSCLRKSRTVSLSGCLRSSYRARWIRNTQLTDAQPGSVEIGLAVRARGASDADARSGLEVSRRARPDVHRAHRDLTHLIRMPLGRLRRLRPAGDRLRERRAVLPKITPQAQLCQQLQVQIEHKSSQMAAESMLNGMALTADIMGVVPDHRRHDRAADRPPTADARSALHGTRP